MNAQIRFLPTTLSLIHIPLPLYPTFLQPILQVLLPPSQPRPDAAALPPRRLEPGAGDDTLGLDGLTLDGEHAFLNISVTPLECSVVCHSALARALFEPAVRRLPPELARTVSVSLDTYAVLSVFSAGTDAGSRVVDLTSPLALAGIPIFFITTYFADFLLVPTRDRQRVVRALASMIAPYGHHPRGPVQAGRGRSGSGSGSGSSASSNASPPSTPPPCDAAELQARTLALLRKRQVAPYTVPGLRLVQCSGREKGHQIHHHCHHGHRPSRGHDHHHHGAAWVDSVDTRLYTALVAAMAAPPRFLSITLAQDDPPSLLLDRALLPVFGDAIVGPTAEEHGLVPIFLDLETLPVEASGIVSGLAGRLVQAMGGLDGGAAVDLSYLSTARAGAVILSSDGAARALEILKPLLVETEGEKEEGKK